MLMPELVKLTVPTMMHTINKCMSPKITVTPPKAFGDEPETQIAPVMFGDVVKYIIKNNLIEHNFGGYAGIRLIGIDLEGLAKRCGDLSLPVHLREVRQVHIIYMICSIVNDKKPKTDIENSETD